MRAVSSFGVFDVSCARCDIVAEDFRVNKSDVSVAECLSIGLFCFLIRKHLDISTLSLCLFVFCFVFINGETKWCVFV